MKQVSPAATPAIHDSAVTDANGTTQLPTESPAAGEGQERARLLEQLTGLGVDAPIVPYPAAASVEEGKRLRGNLAGTFTKNLLLRDKKGGLFFVTAHEDTEIDLRTLHTRVGARGRLGFAPAPTMIELLHVGPGTATPLALINDSAGVVTLVVDHVLAGAEQLNFHPMTPTESIGLTWPSFLAFVRSCGHEPVLADLTAAE